MTIELGVLLPTSTPDSARHVLGDVRASARAACIGLPPGEAGAAVGELAALAAEHGRPAPKATVVGRAGAGTTSSPPPCGQNFLIQAGKWPE